MSSKPTLEPVKQPPRTIRIKRPRDETPVTSLYLDDSSPGDSKRLKTSTLSTPTYFFRLAHTVPTPFQPSTSPPALRSNHDQIPVVLDARKLNPTDQAPSSSGASTPLKRKLAPQDEPTSPSSEYDDGSASSVAGSATPGSNISRAGTPSDTSRGPGAVRRFVLTREAKRKRMHPYRAVFERVQDTSSSSSIAPSPSAEITKQTGAVNENVEPALSAPLSQRKRKLPGIRKDPIERARIEKHQSQQKQKQQQRDDKNDEFDISEEMRKMVLDYLEADTRNALRGLPATAATTTTTTTTTTTAVSPEKPADRIGGGLGGGTWDDTKPSSDAAMGNSDGEDDYVYDIYIREEINAEAANAGKEGENVGVIVFRGEEDEEWWYENADVDDPDDYAFDTDDEDSNAEDYIANEYPDEDEYEWASDDEERGVWDSDDDEGMVEYARGKPVHIGRMGRVTRDSDEEFDLENDSSNDEEERIRRFVREAGV